MFQALMTPSCPAVKISLETFLETSVGYKDGPVMEVKAPE